MTRTPDIRIRVAEAAVSELTEQLAAKTRQLVEQELAHKEEIGEERRLRVEADMALKGRLLEEEFTAFEHELHDLVPTHRSCWCGADWKFIPARAVALGDRPSCGKPECHGPVAHRERTAR